MTDRKGSDVTSANRSPWWAARTTRPTYSPAKVRRFDLSSLLTFATIAVLVGTGIIWTLIGHDPSKPREGQFNSTEYPASINGVLAQCGGIFVFDDIMPQHIGIIPDEVRKKVEARPENEQTYPMHPMIVPVYGYMEAEPIDLDVDRFFEAKDENYPSREKVLRTIYDGVTVIWFNVTVNENVRTSIESYVNQTPGIIAVEWTDLRPLPAGRAFGISTWGASQSCREFYIEVVKEFVEKYPAQTPGAQGKEPPMARLTEDGELHKIALVP